MYFTIVSKVGCGKLFSYYLNEALIVTNLIDVVGICGGDSKMAAFL